MKEIAFSMELQNVMYVKFKKIISVNKLLNSQDEVDKANSKFNKPNRQQGFECHLANVIGMAVLCILTLYTPPPQKKKKNFLL